MTERKTPWTEGPWEYDGNGETRKIRGKDGVSLAMLMHLSLTARKTDAEVVANGHLIAAAPEMADIIPALIVVALDNLDDMDAETRAEVEKDIDAARAALAKARGEQ